MKRPEEVCGECRNTNGEHKPWCSRYAPELAPGEARLHPTDANAVEWRGRVTGRVWKYEWP